MMIEYDSFCFADRQVVTDANGQEHTLEVFIHLERNDPRKGRVLIQTDTVDKNTGRAHISAIIEMEPQELRALTQMLSKGLMRATREHNLIALHVPQAALDRMDEVLDD
jgi:hypothetical protein